MIFHFTIVTPILSYCIFIVPIFLWYKYTVHINVMLLGKTKFWSRIIWSPDSLIMLIKVVSIEGNYLKIDMQCTVNVEYFWREYIIERIT